MKLLITGFKPFLNQTINPSEKLILELQKRLQSGDRKQFEYLILPVEFQRSFDVINSHGPWDRILMFGQARGRGEVCLERVALNWEESNNPDEAGHFARNSRIIQGAPEAYFSSLPLREWVTELASLDSQVKVSCSAGTYVCNDLYFRVLHRIHQTATAAAAEKKALFVHIPSLPEQFPDEPHLSFERILAIAEKIVQKMIQI